MRLRQDFQKDVQVSILLNDTLHYFFHFKTLLYHNEFVSACNHYYFIVL